MRDRKKARERAEALVSQMTVDEMASQLKFDAPAIERLGIPAYNWWNEGLHGVARAGTATVFPQAIAMAAAWDTDLMKAEASVISEEARAKYNESIKHGDRDIYKGLTLWSPNVNIFRDPRWGRGHETYGEDPTLTSRLAVPFIEGLQGDGEYLKTAGCAKHFAVHSGPEALRHSFDAKANKKDMYETYLPAFEACVKEADVEAVMGAYNRTNGEPCCASEELMEHILREDWKFEGHYVSDCWAVRDFHEHHMVTKNGVESSALALNKGCDLNCGCTYLCLKEALNKRLTTKEKVKEAAIRLFTTRFLLGMFDETEFDKIPYTAVESKEHLELSRKAAEESIVLLKNNGILPLKKEELKIIGVIGPNADNRSSLDGNYHGTASRYITVLEGIQDYVGDDVRVMYAKGSHLFLDKEEALAQEDDRVAEALSVAEHSDVVVLCIGLDESLEGEEGDTGNAYASGDKEGLEFPKSQQRLMHAVLETGKKVIVCNFTGSAMNLSEAEEKAEAVIQAWYPGSQGGKALANILFGEVSPSGKLPITFYRTLDELPDFTDYSMKGRTYRYLTEEPLYPFGYGLSYTTFAYSDLQLSKEKIKDTETLQVSVKVKNTGKMAGKEVVQLYVSDKTNAVMRPVNELKNFVKVELQPQEEKTVTMELNKRSFAWYNTKVNDWYAGSGTYEILIGSSSRDIRLTKTVELESTMKIPMEIHTNTTISELMENEKAKEVMKDLVDQMMANIGGGEEGSAASEAISQEMMIKMMENSPLRALRSFAGISTEEVQELIKKLKEAVK